MATFLLFNLNDLSAQCSLACNSYMQVSLDGNCEALITPTMMLNDDETSCPGGVFYVEVLDADGELLPTSPMVTGDYIGQTLTVGVYDENSTNNCWGEIFIEDKMAPVISCQSITMACSDLSVYPGPTVVENCGSYEIIMLNETETVLNCDPDYIKEVVRTYHAIDDSGNVSNTCSQTILLERVDFESVVCPLDRSTANENELACDGVYPLDANGHPDPSYTGVPSIGGVAMYPNLDYYCNTVTTYSDLVLPTIGCVTKIMRTWTLSEWWCGQDNSAVCVQIIEIADFVAPTFDCPANEEVSTSPGYNCHALYLVPALSPEDNCSGVMEVRRWCSACRIRN